MTHGAELPHHDLFLIEAVASLAEEGRAGAVEAHQTGDQQQGGRQQQQADRGQHHVLQTLVEGAAIGRHRAMHQGQRRLRQTLERRIALPGGSGIDQQGQGNGQDAEAVGQFAHAGFGLGINGQDNAVDIGRQAMVQQGVDLAQDRHALDGAGRARQTIVEHAEDIQVATLQGLLDQGCGMSRRPDHDEIRRQGPAAAPARDQKAPDRMGRDQDRQGRQGPLAVNRPGRAQAVQSQTCGADGEGAHGDDCGDTRQMKGDELASFKTVEIQRTQQGQNGHGADRQRYGFDDSRGHDAIVHGEKRQSDKADRPDADHIKASEIEDAKAGGAPLAAVEPEVRSERPASRLTRRRRIVPARSGHVLGVGASGRRGKEGVSGRHGEKKAIWRA
ncbi:hypothetical protein D3C85_615710 [compost metagenome]